MPTASKASGAVCAEGFGRLRRSPKRLGLFLARALVEPDRASVLGRAVVRIGHLGVIERVHAAHRLLDNGRAKTLAEYGAGAEMSDFDMSSSGRSGAVIGLRAVSLDHADRAAARSREGTATARRKRNRGNPSQHRNN